MCCYKKKQSMGMGKIIGMVLAIFGAMAAAFVVFKLLKKHLGCRCDKDKHDEDWYDLGLDESLHVCGCQVPNDDNDMKSEENGVVNSESRMLNIENET